MKNLLYSIILAIFVLILTSCSSGDEEEFINQIALANADVLSVNMSTGAVSTLSAIPADIATNSAYRTTQMIFVRIDGGAKNIGSQSSALDTVADATAETVDVGTFFISAFEVTQGQWSQVNSSTPWNDVDLSGIASQAAFAADTIPAYNIGYAEAQTFADTIDARNAQFVDLPNERQWEIACRAGNNGLFSWGDSLAADVATNYAVVQETIVSNPGPKAVGSRSANDLNVYDMHGNCWEWTSEGTIRGGSWLDPLVQSRSANSATLERGPHALVGFRLVLELN